MRITLITAFPDLLRAYLSASILGRGIAAGKIRVEVLDLRDFAEGIHRQVDDFSFGGGGMVLMAEPLARALECAQGGAAAYVLYPSPQGVALHQELIEDLAGQRHLVIVCGHYEGVDERFINEHVNLEISLGDFVLTGGELPALALVDAVARLIPGVVGKEEAVREDSFYSGMLDNAHYTRPAVWRGKAVPAVLTGGNAREIAVHRRREAALRTLRRRPDVLGRAGIGSYLSHSAYVALSCSDVAEIEGSDLCGMASACEAFGVRKLLLIAPSVERRGRIKSLVAELPGAAALIKSFSSLRNAVAWVEEKEKKSPMVIAVPARQRGGIHWLSLKRQLLERDIPPLLLFGVCDVPEEGLDGVDRVMRPVQSERSGSLCVRATVGIVLDRFFGRR